MMAFPVECAPHFLEDERGPEYEGRHGRAALLSSPRSAPPGPACAAVLPPDEIGTLRKIYFTPLDTKSLILRTYGECRSTRELPLEWRRLTVTDMDAHRACRRS